MTNHVLNFYVISVEAALKIFDLKFKHVLFPTKSNNEWF